MLKLNSYSWQLTSSVLMHLAAAWRNLLSERNYLISIFPIKLQHPKSWDFIRGFIFSKSILAGFGPNTLFTKFSKCSNQESNLWNTCILDSLNERFTQRYTKLLHKLPKRSELIERTDHFREEGAALPSTRQFAVQRSRQCSEGLWPADGGWSSGKNFACQSRHNHRRPWEIPASLPHLATESTR